jgi:ribosomal protein L3 glutamine methyltransferase
MAFLHDRPIQSVLDLCTGSGCLAILAAHLFPDAHVDAVELSADALAVARRNVAAHGLDHRVTLLEGDLFAPVAGRRYDLILTNPPYVEATAMESLPDEFRHEPFMALAGGEDGMDLVRAILTQAPSHLNPGGGMLCEIGTGRAALLASGLATNLHWLNTAESEGEVFWMAASA